MERFNDQKEFVQRVDFSKLVEFVFDTRLATENEMTFISRCFDSYQKNLGTKSASSLEFMTLLFYGCKYGFTKDTEVAVLNAIEDECIAAESSSQAVSPFVDFLKDFVNKYIECRTLSEEAKPLCDELKRHGRLLPLPEYSEKDKELFRSKQISRFSKFVASWGICYLD